MVVRVLTGYCCCCCCLLLLLFAAPGVCVLIGCCRADKLLEVFDQLDTAGIGCLETSVLRQLDSGARSTPAALAVWHTAAAEHTHTQHLERSQPTDLLNCDHNPPGVQQWPIK